MRISRNIASMGDSVHDTKGKGIYLKVYIYSPERNIPLGSADFSLIIFFLHTRLIKRRVKIKGVCL